MTDVPFLNLVLALLATIPVGWLLVVGRTVILPIATVLIAVYVLTAASAALDGCP